MADSKTNVEEAVEGSVEGANEEKTGFKSVSSDISAVSRDTAVLPGKTVYDAAVHKKLTDASMSHGKTPPTQPPPEFKIDLPEFSPYESSVEFDGEIKPPRGYVPMDRIAYEDLAFLNLVRVDPSMRISVWFDEPCPVWFVDVVKPGVRRLNNQQPVIISGLEFASWFYPEYQIFKSVPPEPIDPAEWNRMKKHLLEQCFRHNSQKPTINTKGETRIHAGEGSEIESVQQEFERWGFPPKVWIGSKAEYTVTTKPRMALVDAVEAVMKVRKISFTKKKFTAADVDKVANSLADDAALYGLGEEIDGHFKSGDDQELADWIIVPLMQKVVAKRKKSGKSSG